MAGLRNCAQDMELSQSFSRGLNSPAFVFSAILGMCAEDEFRDVRLQSLCPVGPVRDGTTPPFRNSTVMNSTI